jgi:glycerol kinase
LALRAAESTRRSGRVLHCENGGSAKNPRMISLGIDSGTQSTKTIALDHETGEILASSSHAYGMIEGLPPGHMEQDPLVWIDAVDRTVRDCLQQLGTRKDDVKAIGVSGQQHGFCAARPEGPGDPARETLVRHLDRRAVQAI